jgi:predicted nucleotidyltransferase
MFKLLCINVGREMNQREIAKELNVSSTAISKALNYMEKEELIKIDRNKTMNLLSVILNRENRKVMQLKRVENLKQIYESGLVEGLEEKFMGGTIILFGSYSRGDDTITSDIDIAIISRKEKRVDLSQFEKTLGREIIINFYPSLKEVHKDLRNNLCNGIVLSGGVEL